MRVLFVVRELKMEPLGIMYLAAAHYGLSEHIPVGCKSPDTHTRPIFLVSMVLPCNQEVPVRA